MTSPPGNRPARECSGQHPESLSEKLRRSALVRFALLVLVALPVLPAGRAGPESVWTGLAASGLIFLWIWGALGTENVWVRQGVLIALAYTGFGVLLYVENPTTLLESREDLLGGMLLPAAMFHFQIALWCIRWVRRARVTIWCRSCAKPDVRASNQQVRIFISLTVLSLGLCVGWLFVPNGFEPGRAVVTAVSIPALGTLYGTVFLPLVYLALIMRNRRRANVLTFSLVGIAALFTFYVPAGVIFEREGYRYQTLGSIGCVALVYVLLRVFRVADDK
jgi:hypothetical protein